MQVEVFIGMIAGAGAMLVGSKLNHVAEAKAEALQKRAVLVDAFVKRAGVLADLLHEGGTALDEKIRAEVLQARTNALLASADARLEAEEKLMKLVAPLEAAGMLAGASYSVGEAYEHFAGAAARYEELLATTWYGRLALWFGFEPIVYKSSFLQGNSGYDEE